MQDHTMPPEELPPTLWPEWAAVHSRYNIADHDMPRPKWQTRGFSDLPAHAWNRLKTYATQSHGPLSIYVHIPLCATRCPFCDCHSTVCGASDGPRIHAYVERLLKEIPLWAALDGMADRPITTIHWGGGTPPHLRPGDLQSVVASLRQHFRVHPDTEWAVETTSRCLDEVHLRTLDTSGFRRIHIGIQTLDAPTRRRIGRRDPPEVVMAKLKDVLGRGWVVTADLLYGLPGQTTMRFLEDVQCLVDAGIHGVSLYRLNATEMNRPFIQRHHLDRLNVQQRLQHYVQFMTAAGRLRDSGFQKTHFAHFSRPEDRNLYARCASRGEDLLALGAFADGYFGPYYYRHDDTDTYADPATPLPALQGGGAVLPEERRAQDLMIHLMANTLTEDVVQRTNAGDYVDRWCKAGILTWTRESRSWALTDSGSWILPQCLNEIQ